jgi:NAD(P)-dependent dehydrogenase (short-subunit alcohol dehydrogenase family)
MTEPLAGKKAIVTAGASGIGLEVARACIKAGAAVAVCDIDQGRLDALHETDPGIRAYRSDVGNAAQASRFIETAADALGGIDILINNAGIAGPTAPVEEIAPTDWDATVAVNLSAQFYCARLVVPLMKRNGGGSIVNMSSAAGRLGFPMRTPYAAAKWEVIGLTQSLAMELGPHGIRVNAILPGPVIGERMERVLRDRADRLGVGIDVVREEEIRNISMRKMIEPQEIAGLIVFLCSDQGRSISGQSLGVCGNTETLR